MYRQWAVWSWYWFARVASFLGLPHFYLLFAFTMLYSGYYLRSLIFVEAIIVTLEMETRLQSDREAAVGEEVECRSMYHFILIGEEVECHTILRMQHVHAGIRDYFNEIFRNHYW